MASPRRLATTTQRGRENRSIDRSRSCRLYHPDRDQDEKGEWTNRVETRLGCSLQGVTDGGERTRTARVHGVSCSDNIGPSWFNSSVVSATRSIRDRVPDKSRITGPSEGDWQVGSRNGRAWGGIRGTGVLEGWIASRQPVQLCGCQLQNQQPTGEVSTSTRIRGRVPGRNGEEFLRKISTLRSLRVAPPTPDQKVAATFRNAESPR